MFSYANIQVIVLNFINVTEILFNIHKALASLISRPMHKPRKARARRSF